MFLFQDLIQNDTLHLVVKSLWLFLAVTVSQTFLDFDDFDSFYKGTLIGYFIWSPSIRIGLFFFPKLGWVYGIWEEDHRSKLPLSSHSVKGTYYQITYHCWYWPWLPAGVMLVMFVHCQATLFSPFPYCIFIKKFLCVVHIEGMGEKSTGIKFQCNCLLNCGLQLLKFYPWFCVTTAVMNSAWLWFSHCWYSHFK